MTQNVSLLRRLRHGARLFLDPMERRRDPEREMAINRVSIATLTLCGATVATLTADIFDLRAVFLLYVAYCCAAAFVFLSIILQPAAKNMRRMTAMAMDLAAATAVCVTVGPSGIGFLYPCYLLIIYGYGFRFGPRWLIVSSICSFISLGAVGLLSEPWRDHQPMTAGLLVGLLIIPSYAYHLVGSLMRAKARAEASDRAKSLFVASVSHDLRTPLNAIIGMGDMLASSKLPANEIEMARMIGEAGRSLLGQIDTILDLSRLGLETGKHTLARETLDLYAVLRDMRDLLSITAHAKGVALNLIFEGPPPRWIESSSRALKDCLSNLIGNALKFTQAGKVDVVVRKIEERDGLTRIRFEVIDTGIGVSPLAQAQIFERFTQADESIRDSYGGSGLGLSIVRQLVAAMGGELGVTSVEGAGSTFWFEISARAVEPPTQEHGAEQRIVALTRDAALADRLRALLPRIEIFENPMEISAKCGQATGFAQLILDEDCAREPECATGLALALADAKRNCRPAIVRILNGAKTSPPVSYGVVDVSDRTNGAAIAAALAFCHKAPTAIEPERPTAAACRSILVVEDNHTNQKVIEKMLTRAGQRVAIASNGALALERLAQESFDLILMDVNMPVLGGVEATRRARAMNPPVTAPIIALTADVTPETQALCKAAGMDACATKPIDLVALMRMIEVFAPMEAEDLANASPQPEPLETPEMKTEEAPKATGAFNRLALDDLRQLGGDEFVVDLARQFASDAADLLVSLNEAVAARDLERFHDDAHALRSCSANVGAQHLYELCLAWRKLDPQEFAERGADYVARLETEFARAQAEIEIYLKAA